MLNALPDADSGPDGEADICGHAELLAAITAEIPYLRRYARTLCKGRDDADDLVQGCLTRAIGHLHQFRPGTNLSAWLFTILRNTFLSALRQQRRRPELPADPEIRGHEPNLPPSQPYHCTLRELDTLIGGLPDPMRETLLLVAVEGMTYDEVASLMRVPIGTVRSRLFRARRHLLELSEGRPLPTAADDSD